MIVILWLMYLGAMSKIYYLLLHSDSNIIVDVLSNSLSPGDSKILFSR